MFSWLWLLTCWSWELGAQWCGLLGLCRVQTGHNPLMSVARRSRPGSSETGTWYQSCRCQKTLDLRVERCLCYCLEGFGEAILIPQRRNTAFCYPSTTGRSKHKVSYRTAPPASRRNSMSCSQRRQYGGCLLWPSCSSWRTVSLLTSLNIPAAGILIVSALPGPVSVLDVVWRALVGTTCLLTGIFLFWFYVGKLSEVFFYHNSSTITGRKYS